MKVMLDLNILLDVLQQHEPHYEDSALILSLALEGQIEGCIPGHAITTTSKAASKEKADIAVDWLLSHFDTVAANKSLFLQARQLTMNDFEDAVVASMALEHHCEYIVTRNIVDFASSPVPAILPADLLMLLE